MKKLFLVFGIAVGLLRAGGVFAADTYTIDNAHSTIGFTVKHLMVSNVTGLFADYTGSVTFDPADLTTFKAEAAIQTKSIDTRMPKRDDHLRGADFFDAAAFPAITFAGRTLTGKDGAYTLTGDLTMHGITKEVSMPVTIAGPVKSPMGPDMIIGLSGRATINRQDFGVKWNKDMDKGGLVVGNDITINIELEAHKK